MRRPRIESDEQSCQCRECLEQNTEGLLISSRLFAVHRHRELLRATFPSEAEIDSTEINRPSSSDPPHLLEAKSSHSDRGLSRIGGESSGTHLDETTTVEETAQLWLTSIMAEIQTRLEILASGEIHLEFITRPSPNQPFVFPNADTLEQVNDGTFALDTTKMSNRRFLDAEARFSGLLQTIQAVPLGQRPMGEVDVEKELSQALNQIHHIKERQWTAQAYPNGHGGAAFDNNSSPSNASDPFPATLYHQKRDKGPSTVGELCPDPQRYPHCGFPL
ncbi:hypothetical protein F5878DRAFT_641317 [Lentinula raphanica]|uniref:Uncharacterized protein n=1 Tax=Lentinula raphanica TaxID=153919 RepID=A0AA38PAE2_9AGAR|nr:hypothetical protein F5878DRAFT_641317 [Lentinula raphanica]